MKNDILPGSLETKIQNSLKGLSKGLVVGGLYAISSVNPTYADKVVEAESQDLCANVCEREEVCLYSESRNIHFCETEKNFNKYKKFGKGTSGFLWPREQSIPGSKGNDCHPLYEIGPNNVCMTAQEGRTILNEFRTYSLPPDEFGVLSPEENQCEEPGEIRFGDECMKAKDAVTVINNQKGILKVMKNYAPEKNNCEPPLVEVGADDKCMKRQEAASLLRTYGINVQNRQPFSWNNCGDRKVEFIDTCVAPENAGTLLYLIKDSQGTMPKINYEVDLDDCRMEEGKREVGDECKENTKSLIRTEKGLKARIGRSEPQINDCDPINGKYALKLNGECVPFSEALSGTMHNVLATKFPGYMVELNKCSNRGKYQEVFSGEDETCVLHDEGGETLRHADEGSYGSQQTNTMWDPHDNCNCPDNKKCVFGDKCVPLDVNRFDYLHQK